MAEDAKYEDMDDMVVEEEYFKKFGEWFPAVGFQGDIREKIIECLEWGKPYIPNVPEGAVI